MASARCDAFGLLDKDPCRQQSRLAASPLFSKSPSLERFPHMASQPAAAAAPTDAHAGDLAPGDRKQSETSVFDGLAPEGPSIADKTVDVLLDSFNWAGDRMCVVPALPLPALALTRCLSVCVCSRNQLKRVPQLDFVFSKSWEKGVAVFASAGSLVVLLVVAGLLQLVAPNAYIKQGPCVIPRRARCVRRRC